MHGAQLAYKEEGMNGNQPVVSVIMGSDSDLEVMKGATEILEELGVAVETRIISAHRTPEKMVEYATTAHERGIQIIIAGAGGAAHLPGMVASLTVLPVIGVPVRSKALNGLDSLLSIVQMPNGVPVATVAINAAANAGLFAVRMLRFSEFGIQRKLKDYQEKLARQVEDKDAKLVRIGHEAYLDS
jgi:phosphoribosylaminoimidazole carboxylase PurE protein